MSLTNPNKVVTEQRLNEYHQTILPYLGSMPEMVVNKFSKGDLYSTSEKMIGQWIDSKPLYQKTIVVGTLTQASEESYISLNTPNVDKLIKYDGVYFEYSDNNEFESIFHLANSRGYMCPYKNYANNSLYMAYKLTFDISNVFVTVQYTKTTDSAVSIGNDTDYSTTEKIVGTWITGDPIYQMTLAGASPQVLPASRSDLIFYSNQFPTGISKIVGFKGFFSLYTKDSSNNYTVFSQVRDLSFSDTEDQGCFATTIIGNALSSIRVTCKMTSQWFAISPTVTIQYIKTS